MTEQLKILGIDEKASALVKSVIGLGDNETMLCLDFARSAEFKAWLAAKGYSEKKPFSLGATEGVLYENASGECIYVYTNSGAKLAHAIFGVSDTDDDDAVGEELYDDTIFYQVYNDPDTASGMTYLVRMKDGSFIVIDGGYNIDAVGLINVMRRIHPLAELNGPFEVKAWIFTHPHDDHCQLFHRVMTEAIVRKKLNIKRVYADFSAKELLFERDPAWAPEAERARMYFGKLREGGTEIVKLHTGMSYQIGELAMNVFHTAAEYATTKALSVNDASSVFTLQSEGGKRLMILGDLGEISGEMLLKMYKPGDLHSDIVQIAHHGLNGPDYRLYEAIGATCCFWMINIRAYKTRASKAALNIKLRESGAFHFFSCFGEAHVKM